MENWNVFDLGRQTVFIRIIGELEMLNTFFAALKIENWFLKQLYISMSFTAEKYFECICLKASSRESRTLLFLSENHYKIFHPPSLSNHCPQSLNRYQPLFWWNRLTRCYLVIIGKLSVTSSMFISNYCFGNQEQERNGTVMDSVEYWCTRKCDDNKAFSKRVEVIKT